MSTIQRFVHHTVQVFTSCVAGQIDELNQDKNLKGEKNKKRNFRLWLFRRRGKQHSPVSRPGSDCTSETSQTKTTKNADPCCYPPGQAKSCKGDNSSEFTSATDKSSHITCSGVSCPEPDLEKTTELPVTPRRVTFNNKVQVKKIRKGITISQQRYDRQVQAEAPQKLRRKERDLFDDLYGHLSDASSEDLHEELSDWSDSGSPRYTPPKQTERILVLPPYFTNNGTKYGMTTPEASQWSVSVGRYRLYRTSSDWDF